MSAAVEQRRYDPNNSAVFLKTRERYGGLSNMSSSFPLRINDVFVRSSEALYQCCKFPHLPEIQRRILAEPSPMTAKMVARPHLGASRSDWETIKVGAMRWCLRAKAVQHPLFAELLLDTGDLPIVEKKSRKSDFWGARLDTDGNLVGQNVLGRLLMELREELKHLGGVPKELPPLNVNNFLLLGRPIGTVRFAERNARTSEFLL